MRYLLILCMMFFSACEDKTFSRIYDQKTVGADISTIAISETNQSIKALFSKVLEESEFIIKTGSPFVLEIDGATYPKKCNNPNTSTYEATYDGYLKLTLLKNMKRVYMCQRDYHGTLDEDLIEGLVEKMQRDLKN